MWVDRRADKDVKQDGGTNPTYMLMIRSTSVPSDLWRSHLLSRQRNTTRCAVPQTTDSEFDGLTDSVSVGHCMHVFLHHKTESHFVMS